MLLLSPAPGIFTEDYSARIAPLIDPAKLATLGQLSVDHIIPRAVAPELDNCIANLELLPLKVNELKNDKIGSRQIDLACKLHSAGLLSTEGKQKIDSHPQR